MALTNKKTEKEESITLRVTEALPKDVAKGFARIDPEIMKKINANVGDILVIGGKRITYAKAMPTFSDMRGKNLIQIDGIIRENAKIGIDEKIKIDKAEALEAISITLKAISQSRIVDRASETRYLGRLFEGLPVIKGDKVRISLFGSRTKDFTVINTSPDGPVLITQKTTIRIEEDTQEKQEKSAISYEDIGGLNKEIQRIREMVELPLKSPYIFERLGIEPPKGVLLYGPPGTGKTLIARAVAHESDANFFTINGPEIVHKFYGESEAHLRNVFNEAQNQAPSILFIDEIDSVAPKRMNVQGDVEKRIVATLLSLMDGLKSRGEIIVIGATNMPDLIDPALRRPGRFDREISIGIPDKNGRLKILEIHTRGMPLSEDVSLEKFASITHGYVGADLEALAREAAMTCIREAMQKGDITLEDAPYEVIESLEIKEAHFTQALNEVEPSSIREVSIQSPNVHWSDVGGLDKEKKILQETIQWPLVYPELIKKASWTPTKGVMLVGPPGTGKTLLAKALACESEVNFISIKGPELLSKWVGESEKGIREIFKKSRQASPCILFFDEIDSIAASRGSLDSSGVLSRVMSQFLTELDGLEELRGVVVLGATNRIDLIDAALLRPGRFDHILELPLPDLASREEIFKIHFKDRPITKDINIKELAKLSDGCSGAEIEAICKESIGFAIRNFVESYKDKSNEMANKFVVKKEIIYEVLNKNKKG
jgi:transitional endoplasmic reticulum ATPase